MTALNVMSFDDLSAVKPQVESTRDEIMLGGIAKSTTWLISESPDGKVFTGIWQSDRFHIRLRQNGETEYCNILEGVVRLTDAEGNISTFTAGQAFTLGPNFDGEWESCGRVRKHFVVYAP